MGTGPEYGSIFIIALAAFLMIFIPASSGEYTEFGEVLRAVDISGPRFNHTATLLEDGSVIIIGGTDDGSRSLSSTEIYDPVSMLWKMGPSLEVHRQRHTANILPDGKVLVAGGYIGNGHPSLLKHYQGEGNMSLASCEIFDPATEEMMYAPPLIMERFWHRSVVLSSGDILVIGGLNTVSAAIPSCEIFDTDLQKWRQAAPLNTARARCTATVLSDGRVLVTGGHDGVKKLPYSSCEIYDPVGDEWSYTTPMNLARGYHAGQLLDDGRVIVSGGFFAPGQPDRSDSEVYDPVTEIWTLQGNLSFPRHNHETVILETGEVLMIGGYNCNTGGCHSTMEYYTPSTGEWDDTFLIVMGREWNQVTTLQDGTVLITGGRSCNEPTSRTEIFIPPSIDRDIKEDGFGLSEVAVIGLVALIPILAMLGLAHNKK